MAASLQKKIGWFLAGVSWVMVLALTLYPLPSQEEVSAGTSLWCLVCGELGMVDVTLNVVLFLPLGLGLGLAGVGLRRTVLVVGLTTLTIEVLQLSVVRGRDASLSDLLTNLLGGLLGYALARRWPGVLYPAPGRSLAWGLGWGFGWVLIQAITALAFQRTLPRTVYFGQWAPALGQFERFTGTVDRVQLDSLSIPGTRLAGSAAVRERLLDSASVLRVEARSGLSTADLAPIFSIFDDRQREIVLVGQDDRDLVYRVRTRSGSLGVRGPALRLGDVLPVEAGHPFTISARYRPGVYQLETSVAGRERRKELKLSASWGWTLLLPFDHAFGGEMPWLTVFWLAGMLLPAGYFLGRSRRVSPTGVVVVLAALLTTGLILVPFLFQLIPGGVEEWIPAAGGAAWGFLLGRRSYLSPSDQ